MYSSFNISSMELDDILAEADGIGPPPRKRTAAELYWALDNGQSLEGFYLDDFEEDQRQYVLRFGLPIRNPNARTPSIEPARSSQPRTSPALSGFTASPTICGQTLEAPAAPPRSAGQDTVDLRVPAVRPASPSRTLIGGYLSPPLRIEGVANASAQYLDPWVRPQTAEAIAFVSLLTDRVIAAEAGGRQRQHSARIKMAKAEAVAAAVGGVLLAWTADPAVAAYHSREASSLTDQGVPWRQFLSTLDTLVALGILRHRPGSRNRTRGSGWASRWWPSAELLRMAAEAGLGPDAVQTAFILAPKPAAKALRIRNPITLTALTASSKQRKQRLPIDASDPEVAAILADVLAQNALARATQIEGCAVPQWSRPFHGDFTLGGRFFVKGRGYQAMSAKARLSEIRIAGEPVVEVDIRSCMLALMHGELGLPLPEGDLYALPTMPEVSREVAKHAINSVLGKGAPLRQWPRGMKADCPAALAFSARAIMAAVIERYPFMASPADVAVRYSHLAAPERVLSNLLMGREAQIMALTLAGLREKGVLGLPMHDGVIVPASAEGLVSDLLGRASEAVAGVRVRLKVDRVLAQ